MDQIEHVLRHCDGSADGAAIDLARAVQGHQQGEPARGDQTILVAKAL